MHCGLGWIPSDELIADIAAVMDRVNVPAIGHRIAEDANH
jgi:hypothetical protein